LSAWSRLRDAWRSFLVLPAVWRVLVGRPLRRTRLPIHFLPGDIGLLRSRRPAVLMLGDAVTRRRCLQQLLETELEGGRVTWLGTDEAELRALGPQVAAAARLGRLHALAWTPGAAAALQARGAPYLLQELAACGLHAGELLVVDLLGPWLSGLPESADPTAAVQQACEALQRWAELHRSAPVLALAPTHHGVHALLPLFERSTLAGVAQLQRHGEQVHLDVVRWPEGAAGTVQDLGFGLVERREGGWQADGSGVALDTHELVRASDLRLVIAVPEALADAPGGAAPQGWTVCAGVEALAAECRYVVAASVLLAWRGGDDLATLVDTVRRLRHAHPHALKIVVREVGSSMRYNHELALLRAGANAVLYRDTRFPGVLKALDELRHQTFSRRVAEADGAELLLDVEPDRVRGYLPLAAFCDAAERMLERTEALGMAHCIVQLPLLPEVSHLDALAACHIGRDGDLVTADEQALWLFLFACRAQDVEATLKRLFVLPPSALFNQMRVRPEADSMRRALDRLRRHAVDAVTDYSEALRAVQPARLEVSESGFVMLQPEGQDTLPAALDETPAPPAPPRAPERIQLKLRP
jgi:cellulose biosynthesis protein BcsE